MAELDQNNTEKGKSIDDLAAQSDFLNPAKVEQPDFIEFNFNEPKPIVNPIYPIKDNITGVSPNYYPSDAKKGALNNSVAAGKALFDQTLNYLGNLQDPNQYAEPYAYDPGQKGTFRDRYKAYGQETFNRIGFNPLIDNESWFNANTTFSDDLSRWWNHSAWPMLAKGFMDPIKSYKSIMDGKGLFYADEQSARDYEYYNAIGQSSKGGLGGFTVNLLTSASYSMGILLEGVLEATLIEGMVGLQPGGPAGGFAYGAGKFLNRLKELPKSMYQTAQGVKNVATSVNNYTNLQKAKNLFKEAGGSFYNFMNPLSNTTAALASNVNNFGHLARSSTTAGALWHDIMTMNLALSEGKLEGGFTKYQAYDRMYNEFLNDKERNPEGKAPSLEEQEAMMKEASKGSFYNTMANTGLIFYSNKLVFPALANARFLRGAPKFGFGTVLGDVNKEFQLVFKGGKNIGKATFAAEKIGIVNAIKSLARPATYGKLGLNYFKANVVEGLQEVAQDVLQDSFQNYYVNQYKDPSSKNFMYSMGLLGDALDKQWSSQGFETFMSGFLMGSILQAPSKIKSFMTMGYNDYLRKDNKYRDYIKNRKAEAQEVVDHMNTMWQNSDLFFDPRMNNYATQQLLLDVVNHPDEHTKKEIEDTRFAAFQSAVLSSLQRGTFDMFLNHYEKYKQASPQDIEEAWGLKTGQGQIALNNFNESLKNAKKIQTRWNEAKNKMKFLQNLDDFQKDSYQYKMAKIYNSAYSQALFNYVFLQGSFDDVSQRLEKLYSKIASISAFKNSNFAKFSGFTDPARLDREIDMLNSEIEVLENSEVPISIEELDRKKKLVKLYTDFNNKQKALLVGYFTKKQYQDLSERLTKEGVILEDDAQASVSSIEKLIEQFEAGESNEFLEYKKSFEKLIFGLAKTEEEELQIRQEIDAMEGGFDGLYDALLDTHILKNEKNTLAPLINTLANPTDFYDHVQRNYQFMRNMFYNKKNIIKDIVNTEISNIEKNTLLNTLADQGIYVDLEEFVKWTENPMYRPEYFIDVKNNTVINKNGLLYDEYYKLFEKAAELLIDPVAGSEQTASQNFEDIIDDIEQSRELKIETAKNKFNEALKNKYNATEAELRKRKEDALSSISQDQKDAQDTLKIYRDLLENTENLQLVNPVEIVNKLEDLDVLTEEQFVTAVNNLLRSEGEEFNKLIDYAQGLKRSNNQLTDQDAAILAAQLLILQPLLNDLIEEQLAVVESIPTPEYIDVENTEEWQQYQDELKQIDAEYEELVAQAKSDFEESGQNLEDVPEFTVDDDFNNFPKELQEELTKSFDEFLVTNLKESLSLKDDNFEKYEMLRTRWLESQPNAASIINKYNQKLKKDAAIQASEALKIPKLSFGNLQIDPDTTLDQLTDLYIKYEEAVKTKVFETDDNKKINLSADQVKELKADMKAIATYIEATEKAYKFKDIDNARTVIQTIQETIFDKQDDLIITVDDQGVERRQFKDAEEGAERPDRVTEVASEIEESITGKEPYVYNRLKDGTIQNLYETIVINNTVGTLEERIDNFLAQIKNSYNQFKSDKKIDGIKEMLLEDQSIQNLEFAISKYAHKEMSDAGIYVDAMIRKFISKNPETGKFMEIPYNSTININNENIKISDIISEEAYDYMFNPIKGSVTRFRRNMIDGQFQVFAENVKVFDRNARNGKGVTGELDLLLIDADGNLAIVDIKAAQASTWRNLGVEYLLNKKGEVVNDEEGNPILNNVNKKVYFTAQQSIYGNTVYNMSGFNTQLFLFPLEMKVTKDGYITDMSAPTANLAEYNQISENGMFIILEPLSQDVLSKFGFNQTAPDLTVQEEEKEEEPTTINPEKNTLNDYLDQFVMYQGNKVKLIKNSESGFSIQKYDSGGDPTIIMDLYINGQNIKDGRVGLLEAGILPIIVTTTPAQTSSVSNTIIDAKFTNASEKTAIINGITYTVNRDKTGSIVSLSFNSNDQKIQELQKEIDQIADNINKLTKQVGKKSNKGLDREILKNNYELTRLNNEKQRLIDKNTKRTIRGGNANDLIFALNRLPNSFQKQVVGKNSETRSEQMDEIIALSQSEAIANVLLNIVQQYGITQDVEYVLEGNIRNLTKTKVNNIVNSWAKGLLVELENYASILSNEGKPTTQVNNMIEFVNSLTNSLSQIKFKKDGKPNKKSAERFERESQVQESRSVSNVQESPRTTTKSVSGQTSQQELTELIAESRQKTKGINVTTPVDTTDVISEIEALFDSATLDNINEIYADILKQYVLNNTKGLYTDVVNELYNNKMRELSQDLSIEKLKEEDILINTQPVGTSKKLNQNFIVESINKNKNEVTLYNPKTKKSLTFTQEELISNFMIPTDMEQTTDSIESTPMVKENIKSTGENIQTLVNNPEELEKIEEQSEKLTSEERKEEIKKLFNRC